MHDILVMPFSGKTTENVTRIIIGSIWYVRIIFRKYTLQITTFINKQPVIIYLLLRKLEKK